MKAIPNLLTAVIMELAMICRAELDPELFQDFCFCNDKWSGGDNQDVLAIIYESISPPSSHTSISNVPPPSHSDLGALDDANPAAGLFEGLPTENLPDHYIVNGQSASKRLKIAPKSSGQITTHKNKISETVRQNVSLVHFINMNTEEVKFYPLIFDQDVFQFPSSN
ncbi:hypothetical protein PCANC_08423 [Puccinia coronata f. sp. avenae]|uniref:Uncharacterized protein n=1 Tax=Puccinia coronata f. sp. avenae TaxID=200324 RepID=A0A2N5VPR4_9BASI|nr:hypothetical protein PCASD_25591 [Puccinia coronata f. sp. avenae]PLW20831.1 hypothetical protein PCANC_08241 [Puccinia coronata f. sp. avenae]PLW30078.1 hypothetical protein PCASD_17416 [Puccinia coronata f. sp. avenae]PLW51972.1 hypothetical protein PCANC_08423 [Puccinia coronata f. sp. avenae]